MSRDTMIQALMAARVLPTEEKPWSEHQRWVVEAGTQLLTLGLSSEAIARVARLSWTLAELEVESVVKEVGDGSSTELALSQQRVRRAAVTRLIAAIRHGCVSRTMKRLMGVGGQFHEFASEPQHTPSAAFSAQFGLQDQLDKLRSKVKETANVEDTLALCHLLLCLGLRSEAVQHLAACSANSSNPEALAQLGIAYAHLGQDADARETGKKALERFPTSFRVVVSNAVIRALEAGRTDDIMRATAAIGEALELLEQSTHIEPDGARETMECLMARGQIWLLMPDAFNTWDSGITDMQRALEVTQSPATDIPESIRAIFRFHGCYVLGMALAESDPAKACIMLNTSIMIDPTCNHSEQAYKKVSDLMKATNA